MRGGGEDQRTSTISSSCNMYPDYLGNHFIDMFQIHCREYVFFWFISKFNAAFENMLVCESFLWVIIIIFLSYHPFKECPRMSYLLDWVIGTVSRWYSLDSGTCSCSIYLRACPPCRKVYPDQSTSYVSIAFHILNIATRFTLGNIPTINCG